MPLEMRDHREKCRKDVLRDSDLAFICSYECTFCGPCTEAMRGICPNCGGELLRRPRRKAD